MTLFGKSMSFAFNLFSQRFESLVSPRQIASAAVVSTGLGLLLHFLRKKEKKSRAKSYSSVVLLGSGLALFAPAVIVSVAESGGPVE